MQRDRDRAPKATREAWEIAGAGVPRYVIRAKGDGGNVEFNEPLTLTDALAKAAEPRDARFQHITLINTVTGVEITELEELVRKPALTFAQ